MLLAGTNRENGHLVLAKAVEQWLPDCIQLLRWKEGEQKDGGTKEGEGKGKLRDKVAVPGWIAAEVSLPPDLRCAVHYQHGEVHGEEEPGQ